MMTINREPSGRAHLLEPAMPVAVAPELATASPSKGSRPASRGASATVVLGVRDDEHVDALVEHAAQLAVERHASVLVVHVVHRSELWVLAMLMMDSTPYLRSRRRRLERAALTPLRDRGLDARLVVRIGDPAHQLADVAEVVGADLVVVGGEAHAPKQHRVGSGVAHRLEHLTHRPVEVLAPLGRSAGAAGSPTVAR